MIDNYILFERFVLAVIQQMCITQYKPFYSEIGFNEVCKLSDLDPNIQSIMLQSPNNIMFDGFAPKGFDDFTKPVIIEIKNNPRNMKFYPLMENDNIITLYIINSDMDSMKLQNRIMKKNVFVWDKQKISSWAQKYPIDYYGFYVNDKKNINNFENQLDFKSKVKNNKILLEKMIQEKKISLCLGAGNSIEYGARKWNDLIHNFYMDIKNEGKIDDIQKVQGKIGGTNLINGQFSQDNLNNFMASLYNELYNDYDSHIASVYTEPNTTLLYIAKLIKKISDFRRFNVITYNYDNFLEMELQKLDVEYTVVYNGEIPINDKVNIYHPHGYLPYNSTEKDFSYYKKHIVFSESEYHKLYNNPYFWAVIVQHFLYRENTYLFIGNSLTDPNLRRILETTKTTSKTHFAFMLTDGLSIKDQFIVHRHFARIGVECIWVDSVQQLKNELRCLL